MICTKNIRPVGIQFRPAFHFVRKKNKNEHPLRPPAIEDTGEFKLRWENNWNQKKWKKQKKEETKNEETVKRVNRSYKLHSISS